MRLKQDPVWVVLGAVVCIAVALGVLACLPAWSGMGDVSALEAIVSLVKNGLAK